MQDHAVVLGGSIAGLLAARVLADAYAEVMVLDRDVLAPGVAPRRGAPQGRHIHGLLARGQLALEELFAGLTAELVRAAHPSATCSATPGCCSAGTALRAPRPGCGW